MKRILLIDDEDSFRGAIARYLRSCGYQVLEASDGSEVTEVVDEEGSPDLVVTDINMPGTDGLELIRTFRKAGVEIPVIAISGGGTFSNTLLLANAKALGASATLEKPFELETLRVLVEDMLAEERR